MCLSIFGPSDLQSLVPKTQKALSGSPVFLVSHHREPREPAPARSVGRTRRLLRSVEDNGGIGVSF